MEPQEHLHLGNEFKKKSLQKNRKEMETQWKSKSIRSYI